VGGYAHGLIPSGYAACVLRAPADTTAMLRLLLALDNEHPGRSKDELLAALDRWAEGRRRRLPGPYGVDLSAAPLNSASPPQKGHRS
jgi:hypothetical protein